MKKNDDESHQLPKYAKIYAKKGKCYFFSIEIKIFTLLHIRLLIIRKRHSVNRAKLIRHISLA